MLGDHGLSTKGAFMYDPCTRVPMIIQDPKQEKGRIVDIPCQLHDIAATSLAIGSYDNPSGMVDSCNLLDDHSLNQRGYAVCMHRNSSIGHGGYYDPELHVSMWRQDNYKLNIYHSPAPEPNDCPEELFNLDDDVGEMNNLWFSERLRDTRDQLVHRLTTFLVKQDSKGRVTTEQALPPRFKY